MFYKTEINCWLIHLEYNTTKACGTPEKSIYNSLSLHVDSVTVFLGDCDKVGRFYFSYVLSNV